MNALAALLSLSLPSAPVERQLDAGTWVRQSLTVLPASIGECPPYEVFERRAWIRFNAEILPMQRPFARAAAHREKDFCEEARAVLLSRLAGDWSRLTSMDRFDRNDLPGDLVQNLSSSFLHEGSDAFEQTLRQAAADTLRGLLAAKALERSEHLASDQQLNSAVATKMRTQDVTDEELALLRGSAHVLALRVSGLDVRGGGRKGLEFRASFQAAIWSFDPVARSFAPEAAFAQDGAEVSPSPGEAGSAIAERGLGFAGSFLNLKAFRFTTQILSGNEGWWLRPASKFQTNTRADLRIHRRFLYMENRAVAGGSDVQVQAGYGYVDHRFAIDSSWRLRHIGGIRPYAGLVLEEVPGNTWSPLSVAWVQPTIEGKSDTNDRGTDGRYVAIRHTSPLLEFRFGVRTNLGDLPNQHFLFDLPLYFGSVEGAINEEYDTRPGDSIHTVARMPTSLLWGFGLEPGWCFRVPIRRLFFTGGAQVGLRFNFIELGEEEVVDQYGNDHTPYDRDDLPLTRSDVRELMSLDGTVSVRGGLQWSLTPWSGLGFEVMYDLLRGEGGMSYRTGSVDKGDWTSVGGPTTGQGRLRWMFQYVWK
jgi:hypothetical protein